MTSQRRSLNRNRTIRQWFLLALLLPMPLIVQADTLTVIVKGILEFSGNIRIAVMDSEAAFKDKSPPAASSILPATASTVTYKAELPTGQYAIKVMHDLNDNQEMDSNLVGMPREPFGFSNDAKGNFGPPKWKAAVFELNGEKSVTIELVH